MNDNNEWPDVIGCGDGCHPDFTDINDAILQVTRSQFSLLEQHPMCRCICSPISLKFLDYNLSRKRRRHMWCAIKNRLARQSGEIPIDRLALKLMRGYRRAQRYRRLQHWRHHRTTEDQARSMMYVSRQSAQRIIHTHEL